MIDEEKLTNNPETEETVSSSETPKEEVNEVKEATVNDSNQEPVQEVVDNTSKKRVKKPKSKARKIIEWVLLGIFLVIFGYIAAGTVDGMVHKNENFGQTIRFGWGSFIVLTNSMEPELKTNSAIVTYKENIDTIVSRFNAGENVDVTFFNQYTGIDPNSVAFIHEEFKPGKGGQCIITNKVMTHRIQEIHIDETKQYGQGRYLFVTAGINTGGVDSLKGQYQFCTEKEYLGSVKFTSPFMGGVFQFIASPWGLIVLLLIPAGYLIVTSAIDIFKALKESDDEKEIEKQKAIDSGTDRLNNMSEEDKERLKRELLDDIMKKRKGGK